MLELNKLQEKRELWNNNKCNLMFDSYTKEAINLEFQSIDLGLNKYLANNVKPTKRVVENYLVNKLQSGIKLKRGWF